ncbi:ATP-dependent endonuclease [Oceanicaulis sp. MMSF_3324]|uniref:ATP-dependent nuclease n=1 Tax=Oceanicaulis sp. MMSF_3324 TaxID=3046702 RepID=UPI00273F041A|nr:AAA family ATPase [Oceanicaulis sp. MMSF_3324]
MRAAKLSDYLRSAQAYPNNYPIKVNFVEFKNFPILGDLKIVFSSPINVFVGANGVGKTTLLSALWASFSPEDFMERNPAEAVRLEGQVQSGLEIDEKEVVADVCLPLSDEMDCPIVHDRVHHLNASYDARRALDEFLLYDIDDILNGIGEYLLTDKELEEVARIFGRDYSSISMYELDLDGVRPFFKVVYGDVNYDSTAMGAGEYIALYMWWFLRTVDKGSIVFLEEPEAFLSPGAQTRLFEHIVMKACTLNWVVFISTHSTQAVELFLDENLHVLSRSIEGVNLVGGPGKLAVTNQLGVNTRIERVCFVEDNRAKRFLKQLLYNEDPVLAHRSEIFAVGGSGNISKLLKTLPASTNKKLKIWGIYDGDLREDPSLPDDERIRFLPGSSGPETLIKSLVKKGSREIEASFSLSEFDAVCASIEGADPHDWIEELKGGAGLDEDTVIRIFVSQLIKESYFNRDFQRLIDGI